jgi:branched-chain amino acid transport system ATP-binding protein
MSPLLEVEGVGKRFAGVEALRDVSFTLAEGEILALIGPNGAGKTTLLSVVAGELAPDAGRVRLRGASLPRRRPHEVSGRGLARTFQLLELFGGLTVRENVMAGGVARGRARLLPALLAWPSSRRLRADLAREADRLLAAVGLTRWADEPAATLPAGLRRLLAIARSLATGAGLLVLDEPGAGLNESEKAHLVEVVARFRADGRTILFVEHDMTLVGRLADRVLVLDRGQLIAEGTPEAIRRDARVVRAYLGEDTPRPAPPGERPPAARVPGPGPLLALERVDVAYGGAGVLHAVSLEVAAGEIVALVGANGAGKSTLLRAVSRVAPLRGGVIRFAGHELNRCTPEAVVRLGVGHVPEGRELFASLSVWDNLVLGRYSRAVVDGNLLAGALRHRRARAEVAETAERVFALFPVLAERRRQRAGTLSGGEGQMLAIGRALMARPRLLMLDEPSLGLGPRVVCEIMERLVALRREGLTILLVEQRAHAALEIADRGYVLETGRVVSEGPGPALAGDPEIARAYLGRDPGRARP